MRWHRESPPQKHPKPKAPGLQYSNTTSRSTVTDLGGLRPASDLMIVRLDKNERGCEIVPFQVLVDMRSVTYAISPRNGVSLPKRNTQDGSNLWPKGHMTRNTLTTTNQHNHPASARSLRWSLLRPEDLEVLLSGLRKMLGRFGSQALTQILAEPSHPPTVSIPQRRVDHSKP